MKFSTKLILPAAGLISAVAIVISVYMMGQANKVEMYAAEGGKSIGAIVGAARGSFDGITKGAIEGTAAGKELGLSAVDTAAVLKSNFKEVNKLEVLDVSFSAHNLHDITGKKQFLWFVLEEEYVKFASLSVIKGSAVYTVDLSQAEIFIREDNGIDIRLPKPEIQIRDEDQKTLDTYQAGDYTGSAQDGIDAATNSAKEEFKKTKEEFEDNESLMETAKQFAIKYVKQLAENVRPEDGGSVNVYFADEEV